MCQINSLLTANELLLALEQIAPLGTAVDCINPETMCVVVVRSCLEEAIEYYSKYEPALLRMPDFIVIGKEEECNAELAEISKKHNVSIETWDVYARGTQRDLCVYATPKDKYWKHDAFGYIFTFLQHKGITEFYFDKYIATETNGSAPDSYLLKRIEDICIIYNALADAESKEVYLRSIKAHITGDASYMKMSEYEQYYHPVVQAEFDDVIIEGGLRTGDTTLSFSQKIGEKGNIFAFSPVCAVAQKSREKVKNCTNVIVEQLGLWSGQSRLYVEDAGEGRRLVATPNKHTEECSTIDIDLYLQQKKSSCSLIKLDVEGVEEEVLKGAFKTIALCKPKLQISLYHKPEHYIDLPLMLLKKIPDYTFYCGHHGTWHYNTVLYAKPPKKLQTVYAYPQLISNKISVIVPCYNNEQTLASCLDSILLQSQSSDFEIIIVDDASTDGTQEIIQRYVKQFPNIVRSMRFPDNRGAGQARNAGMCMAKGEFMAFVDSDDGMAPDFLTSSLAIMQEEQADIVAFDMLTTRQNPIRAELWGVKSGSYAHEESLKQFLLKKIGGYGTVNRLYRVEVLRKNRVFYGTSRVHEDMIFAIAAFYHSAKTVACDTIGYYRNVRQGSLSVSGDNAKHFESFFETTAYIDNFFTAHNLNTTSEAYLNLIKQLYTWDRNRILYAVNEAKGKETLHELLSKKQLMNVGASTEVLRLILQDYAQFNYYQVEPRATVTIDDRNWRQVAAKPLPEVVCLPYADADTPTTPEPTISIIIPSYNSKQYILTCLNSILKQITEEIEIIIVDDHSTDGSYEVLQMYAAKTPAIRVYRMKENCKQGACRNIGIEKARGKYITFIDSNGRIKETFLGDTILAIQEYAPDILIYSLDTVDENDNFVCTKSAPDAIYRDEQAFNAFMDNKFSPVPHAKFYKKAFIVENYIIFPHNTYLDDIPFFISAIKKSSLCVSISTVQYTYTLTTNSHIHPKNYSWMHIYSCYQFFIYMQKEYSKICKDYDKNNFFHTNMLWAVNEFFIPACGAFLLETDELPLTDEILHFLQTSPIFLQTLLSCFAQKAKEKSFNSLPILTSASKSTPHNGIEYIENIPYVSVIVPVYNQEQYLGRCLDSILKQPLQNFEVLLIDDASTDFTAQICAHYAAKDARIRFFTNAKNSGQGYSRNFAMEKARAPYVTFVDSDDYIEPCLLSHGVQVLHNTPHVDIVHFGHVDKTVGSNSSHSKEIPQGIRSGLAVFEDFCHGKIPSYAPWGKVYRKSYFDKYNILSPEYMWEDNFFTLKAYYYARNIYFTGQHGYTRIFTPHEASTVTPLRLTPKHINGLCYLVYDLEQFSLTLNDDNHKKCIEILIRSFAKHRFKTFFPYLQSCMENNIFPISDDALHSFINAPSFLSELLEDFAELYSKQTNHKVALPQEDFLHPDKPGWKEPASDLITLLDHAKDQKNIDVSVIVPAFHVGVTLACCLESILIQKANFEIILVEDNSINDNTLEVCLEYARKHECIRLFQTPWNSGLGTVRNLAMQKARGTYITFVDSDDYLESIFFQRALIALTKHHDAELLLCNSITHWGKNKVFSCVPDAIISGEEMLEAYLFGKFKHWASWGIFYKRSYLEQNNFCCGTKNNEDEILLLNIYYHAQKVILSSFVGYNYIRYTTRPTGMQPRVRGKKYFESTIYNIQRSNDFFATHPEIDAQIVTRKYRAFFSAEHHLSILLHYIYACKVLNQPSPLTPEILKVLTSNKMLLSELLQAYIALTQQKSFQQHNTHGTLPADMQAKQSLNTRNTVLPELGAGSLWERILWHIFPTKATIRAIKRSNCFDIPFYLSHNPHVARENKDPIVHYVYSGAKRGKDPAPWFNTEQYQRDYPATTTMNPFYHFLYYGHKEGKKTCNSTQNMPSSFTISLPNLERGSFWGRILERISPSRAAIRTIKRSHYFDAPFYLSQNPHLKGKKVDLVKHYVYSGAKRGRNPVPWFDTKQYQSNCPATANMNPFCHYLRFCHKQDKKMTK